MDDTLRCDRTDTTLLRPRPARPSAPPVRAPVAARGPRLRWWAVALVGVVLGWFVFGTLGTVAVAVVLVTRGAEEPEVLPPLTRVFPADR